MTDNISKARRSRNMAAIRSKDMKPEMFVRSLVHSLGYRFRLHRRDLPGSPDVVFPSRKKIIFVHGCFWHGHDDSACLDGRAPRSNQSYWLPKLTRNKERDFKSIAALEAAGWQVLVIWECETRDAGLLQNRLEDFLKEPSGVAV